jgi:hypothetical protein
MGRIFDSRFAIFDLQKPRAAVVGDCNQDAGAGRIGGGKHGSRDFLRRTKRDGTNGGTGAAQEGAEGTGRSGSGDDFIEEWDQFFAEGLVEMIRESAAERLVFARSKRSSDGAGVPRILHRLQTIDPGGKEPARFFRGDFEIGHKKNEMELRGNGKHLAVTSAHDIEATVTRGRGIIGMAFEPGADLENFPALQGALFEFVQTVKDTKSKGRAAAETARWRNIAGNCAGKRKCPGPGVFEKGVTRRTSHRSHASPSPARDGHLIIKAQGKPEAIKARAEIRCARRNADGDLLHDSGRSKAKRDPL